VSARIVLVHDDAEFLQQVAAALRTAGHVVADFTDPMPALGALEEVREAALLITRIAFGPGKINGVALARMARLRRPGIKLLFLALPGAEHHAEGLGEVLLLPTGAAELVEAAGRLLSPVGENRE
jgi:DNA-binding response OmpR family regulator